MDVRGITGSLSAHREQLAIVHTVRRGERGRPQDATRSQWDRACVRRLYSAVRSGEAQEGKSRAIVMPRSGTMSPTKYRHSFSPNMSAKMIERQSTYSQSKQQA